LKNTFCSNFSHENSVVKHFRPGHSSINTLKKKLGIRNHGIKIYYRHPQQLSAQSGIYVFLLISLPLPSVTLLFFCGKPSHQSTLIGSYAPSPLGTVFIFA